MQNVNTLCIAAQSPQDTHSTYGIVQRTESDRAADGNQRRCAAHRCTNKANRESVPQNTLNTQNILAEKCLPQIAQMRTD